MDKKKYLEILKEFDRMEEAAYEYAREFITLQLFCDKNSFYITELEFGEDSFWFQYTPDGCDTFCSETKTIPIEQFLEWYSNSQNRS